MVTIVTNKLQEEVLRVAMAGRICYNGVTFDLEMIRAACCPDRHKLKLVPKRTICKQIGAEMIRQPAARIGWGAL